MPRRATGQDFIIATSTSRNSPYGPIALRDEPWWQIGRRAAQRGDMRPDGSNNGPAIALDMARSFHSLRGLHRNTPDEEAREAQHLISGAFEWTEVVGHYELLGRQIFDLSGGLVDMLQQTDVRDCSLRSLQLPYPAFYMRFGTREDLKSVGAKGAPEYIDGVLVSFRKGSKGKVLALATTSVDESGVRMRQPGHYLDLHEEEMQLPVHSAVEVALQRFIRTGVDPMPETPWLPALWTERRQCATVAVLAIMPLIVNGLFYLENPPRPARTALGSGVPGDLVDQWERTPSDRRRKLISKLNAEGYTVVHLVGEEIARSSSLGFAGTVVPHWRRGHWREQAHGPRLSLRKRILIRPTLVNGREVTDPLQVQGHVYRASGDESPPPLA
jgi:hypothetical protein